MKNCISKNIAHFEWQSDNSHVIEIIKKVYQALLLASDVVYSSKNHLGEDKLERTLYDSDEFSEKTLMVS